MIKYEPWMDKEKAFELLSAGLLEVSSENLLGLMDHVFEDGWSKGYGRGFEDGYVQRDEELRQE